MPNFKDVSDRQQRQQMAEDMERHLQEASGEAGMISSSLEEAGNPADIVKAWQEIAEQLAQLHARVSKLAR